MARRRDGAGEGRAAAVRNAASDRDEAAALVSAWRSSAHRPALLRLTSPHTGRQKHFIHPKHRPCYYSRDNDGMYPKAIVKNTGVLMTCKSRSYPFAIVISGICFCNNKPPGVGPKNGLL
jgi:hypothetical protein